MVASLVECDCYMIKGEPVSSGRVLLSRLGDLFVGASSKAKMPVE